MAPLDIIEFFSYEKKKVTLESDQTVSRIFSWVTPDQIHVSSYAHVHYFIDSIDAFEDLLCVSHHSQMRLRGHIRYKPVIRQCDMHNRE